MSQDMPKKKVKAKGQASPFSFFIMAFLAFIFDAPEGIVVFLVIIGIIFWHLQRASKKMAKLPPLPPLENGSKPSESNFPPLPHEIEIKPMPGGLSDSSWGRSDAPVPAAKPASQTEPKPVSTLPPSRPSEPGRERTIDATPSWNPTSVAVPSPSWETAALQTTAQTTATPSKHNLQQSNAYRVQPKRQASNLGVNLATEAGLRQAVIAMTVLGPCRALSPYQEEGPIAAKQLTDQDLQNKSRGE